ncbi:MAG: hypothetical protein GOU99_02145 [Candidatus Altiarchaeota archaeon]|nr:hypothetical protein [Candidatus Altiarchaeota archaeon]
MNKQDWLWTGVEAIVGYGFIYYALYSIKNPVNLYASALTLLVLCYVGILACPWFRQTKAFKELLEK